MKLVALASITVVCCVSVPAFGGPLDDLAPGHWYEVPGSQLSALDPCPSHDCSYTAVQGQSAVIDVWNGGAFATGYGTKGGLIVWGGGHTGYYGNEVYVFDVDELAWKMLSQPVEDPVCSIGEGELQDGSPCSAHSFDGVQYHPGTNSFVLLAVVGLHDGIQSSGRAHLFDLDTHEWRRGAVYDGNSQGMYGTSAYDPKRDVFFMYPGYNAELGEYDPNANGGEGSWTLHEPYNADTGSMGAVDPTRDLMVWIDGYSHHELVVFDLADPDHPVKPPVSGDTTPMQEQGNGFDWDPEKKAFVAWVGGTSVYTLTPPDGDWKTGTWQWAEVPAAPDNRTTPSEPNENHTYSRWRYVPSLNAWVVVNRTSDNVFFYKLSEGTGTGENPPGTGGSSAGGSGGSGGATTGNGGSATGGVAPSTGGASSAATPSGDSGGCNTSGTPPRLINAWWLGLLAFARRRRATLNS